MRNDEPTRQTERLSTDWNGRTVVTPLVALTLATVLLVGGVSATEDPRASCSLSETTVLEGGSVTIDPSDSVDAAAVEYDVDGDGVYERSSEPGESISVTYKNTGSYRVLVRVESSEGETDRTICGTVTVESNRRPEAAFEYAPSKPEVGQSVAFDAVDSRDPDGQIVEYRWDFDSDGTVDLRTADPTINYTYGYNGTREVTLTVVDDHGTTVETTTKIEVEPMGPMASCRLSRGEAETGQIVEIDATHSRNGKRALVDVDGNGTYDRTLTADFAVTVSYNRSGTYTPRVEIVGTSESETTTCGTLEVTGPPITTTSTTTTTTTSETTTAATATTATTTTATTTGTTTAPATSTTNATDGTGGNAATATDSQPSPGFGGLVGGVAVVLGMLLVARRRQ